MDGRRDGRKFVRAGCGSKTIVKLRAMVAISAIAVAFLPLAVRGGVDAPVADGPAITGLEKVENVAALAPVKAPPVQDSVALAPTTAEKPDEAIVTELTPPVRHSVIEKKESVEKKEAVPVTAKSTEPLSDLERSPIGGKASPVETSERKLAVDTTIAPASKSMVPSGVSNAIQVIAALTAVVGLILIGKALAKKYLPQAKVSNGKGVIEVLARYPLSKNQSLVLVRIGSQVVALNQGKEMSQSVLVINEPTEVAKLMGQVEGQNPNSIQAGFSKLLANARMDLEDPANDPDREEEQEMGRNNFEIRSMDPDNLDSQLEEMAAAKRQLMELRQQVRSVRDSLPRA